MNILIAGVGGQGAITLKRILSYMALKEKQYFRASELHGLSQRGGSVTVHFKFDKNKIYSPSIGRTEADLIIGLDLLEATRAINYASSDSTFLVNDHFLSFIQLAQYTKKEFLSKTRRVTNNTYIVEATKICQEQLKNSVFESVFLLGFASANNLIPVKEKSLLFGIEKSVPVKHIEDNIKAFDLGKEYGNT